MKTAFAICCLFFAAATYGDSGFNQKYVLGVSANGVAWRMDTTNGAMSFCTTQGSGSCSQWMR